MGATTAMVLGLVLVSGAEAGKKRVDPDAAGSFGELPSPPAAPAVEAPHEMTTVDIGGTPYQCPSNVALAVKRMAMVMDAAAVLDQVAGDAGDCTPVAPAGDDSPPTPPAAPAPSPTPSPVKKVAPTSWPSLSTPLAAEGLGAQDAAVVVGIEDYLFVDDIAGAQQNVADWYAWLVKTRGVPLSHVRLLKDQHATREQMLAEAKWAAERVGPGGTLWFVYVGHGAPAPDGSDGLLVGADVQQTANSVLARSLPQETLLETLEAGQQQDTIVVIDACFSGRSENGALVAGLQPMIPTYATPETEATVLAAGQGDEFAGPLPGLERPAFSYLVLGALRGWGDANGDGGVTASEAVEYAQGAMTALLQDRRQTPELLGQASDAPLSRGSETGPDLIQMALGQ